MVLIMEFRNKIYTISYRNGPLFIKGLLWLSYNLAITINVDEDVILVKAMLWNLTEFKCYIGEMLQLVSYRFQYDYILLP